MHDAMYIHRKSTRNARRLGMYRKPALAAATHQTRQLAALFLDQRQADCAFASPPQNTPTQRRPRWRLESGVGVVDEVLEVGLVPLAGLGRGLESIRLAAEAVVAGGRAVAGAVGLATGLDPDESVGELGTGVGRGADTEAGALDVAPVAPLLTETLDAVTGSIDDGVVGHAGGLEGGTEGGDVGLLVLASVVLGIRLLGKLAGAEVPRVPASNVGGETTELLGLAGVRVGLGQLLRTGLEVGIPAEPSAVAGIDVLDDVGEVERLESIRNTVTVSRGRVLAGLEVRVGDQVGQGVGLDEEHERRGAVLLEESSNDCRSRSAHAAFSRYFGGSIKLTVDVLGLVLADLTNLQLTVGGLGGAVTAGKIVDNDTQDLVARNISDSGLELGDVRDGVEPQEGTDISNLLRLGLDARVHGGESSLDLAAVEVVSMELVLLEDVGAGVESDSRRAASGDCAGRLLGGLGGRSGGRGGQPQESGLGELHVGLPGMLLSRDCR